MGLGGLLAAATLLTAVDASALLLEDGTHGEAGLEMTYFYPYPTTYDFVDERFAFDDDPLEAFLREPYFMPVVVKRVEVRRMMVEPRRSFVHEMYRSTEAI